MGTSMHSIEKHNKISKATVKQIRDKWKGKMILFEYAATNKSDISPARKEKVLFSLT